MKYTRRLVSALILYDLLVPALKLKDVVHAVILRQGVVPVLILYDLLVPALKYWQAVLVVILRQGVVLVLIFAG